MQTKDLIIDEVYQCEVNDIVSSWEEALTWLGDGWSHHSQNVDGYYPCIVHKVKFKL